MVLTPLSELDIFYISYDEPDAELNWADLLEKAPWAKRVHGVTGFDAAHKACAEQSQTDRFVTVDGDNVVDVEFFDQQIDLVEGNPVVYSWASRNNVNGLMYGNGGLKCWPKDVALGMMSHENAAEGERNQIEFCWTVDYVQLNNVYSDTVITGSPFQAWRAGFREGVKMSLDRGERVEPPAFSQRIHRLNYQRLLIWCTIGEDVSHGHYAMLGARDGCHRTALTDWDFRRIRDYGWFRSEWDERGPLTGDRSVPRQLEDYGRKLRIGLGLEVAEFDQHASRFFKRVYPYPVRHHVMQKEIA